MTSPINQREHSPNLFSKAGNLRFANSPRADNRPSSRFELTFCGVLVVLILAVICILLASLYNDVWPLITAGSNQQSPALRRALHLQGTHDWE